MRFEVGQAVEVKFNTHDNTIWRRATVEAEHSESLVVAYRDGVRRCVPLDDVRAAE